jgi:hypothetical protein
LIPTEDQVVDVLVAVLDEIGAKPVAVVRENEGIHYISFSGCLLCP